MCHEGHSPISFPTTGGRRGPPLREAGGHGPVSLEMAGGMHPAPARTGMAYNWWDGWRCLMWGQPPTAVRRRCGVVVGNVGADLCVRPPKAGDVLGDIGEGHVPPVVQRSRTTGAPARHHQEAFKCHPSGVV